LPILPAGHRTSGAGDSKELKYYCHTAFEQYKRRIKSRQHCVAATSTAAGLVLYQGKMAKGGKVILVPWPTWRLHYFRTLAA
jgi:hypothetical protein